MKTILIALAILIFLPASAMANLVTITDSPIDNIPLPNGTTETYSITIDTNPASLSIRILTNQPQDSGFPNEYAEVADLFLDRSGNAAGWDYAIPLVPHGTFAAGQVYNITSVSSGDLSPIWGPEIPYRIASGTPVGWSGKWDWQQQVGQNPDWEIIYSDANWTWSVFGQESVKILWATSKCTNDIINGVIPPNPVPGPATILLLSSGLVGLAGYRRLRRKR